MMTGGLANTSSVSVVSRHHNSLEIDEPGSQYFITAEKLNYWQVRCKAATITPSGSQKDNLTSHSTIILLFRLNWNYEHFFFFKFLCPQRVDKTFYEIQAINSRGHFIFHRIFEAFQLLGLSPSGGVSLVRGHRKIWNFGLNFVTSRMPVKNVPGCKYQQTTINKLPIQIQRNLFLGWRLSVVGWLVVS